MISARFVVEYPKQCLDLIEALEPIARGGGIAGSFSLVVAAAVFVIPYERMPYERMAQTPPHRQTRHVDLFRALKDLEQSNFGAAPFWKGNRPNAWRFSHIVTNADDTVGWRDDEGRHPMSPHAKDSLPDCKADQVLRVIRNALVHGNVVYLTERGVEHHGAKLQFLGFLSRFEESEDQRAKAETYRLVTTTESEFLRFVKLWAEWVSQFRDDDRLSEAA